jgi:hypothetical protein
MHGCHSGIVFGHLMGQVELLKCLMVSSGSLRRSADLKWFSSDKCANLSESIGHLVKKIQEADVRAKNGSSSSAWKLDYMQLHAESCAVLNDAALPSPTFAPGFAK